MHSKTTQKVLLSSLLFSSLLVSSCSWFGGESYYHKQQVAYSKAEDGPGLVVEPPLSKNKMSDAYVIPPMEKAPVSIEAPPPPGSKVDPLRQAVPKDPSGD